MITWKQAGYLTGDAAGRLFFGLTKTRIQRCRLFSSKPQADPVVIENVLPVLENDTKTISLRSFFFETLISDPQVTAVGMGAKPKRGFAAERVVKRDEFSTFVVQSDKLPTVTHHDAVIEIVAPVIGKGSFHWRGIWQGQPITFQMRDGAFRKLVQRGQVGFKTGDAIKCELQVERKVDGLGDELVTGHVVKTVSAKIEGLKVIETVKGAALRHANAYVHGPQKQMNLNLLVDEGTPRRPDHGN